jgi:hypothetical protein
MLQNLVHDRDRQDRRARGVPPVQDHGFLS